MFQQDTKLQPYNTFGLNVTAKYFASFDSTDRLRLLLQNLPTENFLVLGGGSNLLFTQSYNGTVLRNEMKGVEKIKEDEDFVYVKAGGGEVWHNFVLYTIDKGWGGIENLSLIPGSVGASPMQNIGAYGVEIKDVFEELEAYHIPTGEIHTFTKESCQFGYRESVFKRKLKGQYILLNVTYRLSKKPIINTRYGAINDELQKAGITSPTIKDVSDAVIRIRQSKLPNPAEIGNAGSFFKNPVVENIILEKIKIEYPEIPHYPVDDHSAKIPAGWLIEKAGWKGKRFGNYGVHTQQALVLVNYNNADGKDIFNLSQKIIDSIKSGFGIELEREVNII